MKTISDLLAFIQAGNSPIVTFAAGIADKEGYPEAGMRARITAAQEQRDDVIKLTFSFEDFDEFNKSFESSNYYDKGGKPVLNAREAGYYKPEEALYFSADESIDSQFSLENTSAMALYEEYRGSRSEVSYVSWLEAQLLQARAA